jgi:PAS domain S-box-containing protein
LRLLVQEMGWSDTHSSSSTGLLADWQLLESAPDAMLIVDEYGTILLANSQTAKLFGYSREELIGQTVEKLMPPRFRETHTKHRGQFFSAPRLRPMGAGLDLYGLRRDGSEFSVEISLNPIATEGRTLVTSSIRDISDRKRAEQELRRAVRVLRELRTLQCIFCDEMVQFIVEEKPEASGLPIPQKKHTA